MYRKKTIVSAAAVVLLTCVFAKDESDIEIVKVETTTEEIIIITDIPESDVVQAMNLDVGMYTTQRFDYFNFKFEFPKKHEHCYENYMKCLLTQEVPHPVCAVNDAEDDEGWYTFNSYCDMFYDNCRREIHFWHPLDVDDCSTVWYRDTYL